MTEKKKGLVAAALEELDHLPEGPNRFERFMNLDPEITCPHCGRVVPARWRYCIGGCGKPLRQ